MSNPLPLLVANLKANLTWGEISSWIDKIGPKSNTFKGTVILCPSSPFLKSAAKKIKESSFNIKLGPQDISKFQTGAYTGETAASQIKDFCQFCIVGHSERRKYFTESDLDVSKKLTRLLEAQISPILCISDPNQLQAYFSSNASLKEKSQEIIFVYEPPDAISGGGAYKPESPRTASENAAKFQDLVGQNSIIIYGGSVNPQNVKSFLDKENIHGALVGQASLDPESFGQIVEASN